MSDEHVHDWKLPDGPFFVVDTYPAQYPYVCECGAFTHDPASGRPCSVCAPADWERRAERRAVLRGGTFDGCDIACPEGKRWRLYFRVEDGRRTQRVEIYEPVEGEDAWAFYANIWTRPAAESAAANSHSQPDEATQ